VVFEGRIATPEDVGSLYVREGVLVRDGTRIRVHVHTHSTILVDEPAEIVMLAVSK
jgi:hypothetical protein